MSDIIKALNALDEDFKTVVVLRDIEGMEYSQISEIIGCPEESKRKIAANYK